VEHVWDEKSDETGRSYTVWLDGEEMVLLRDGDLVALDDAHEALLKIIRILRVGDPDGKRRARKSKAASPSLKLRVMRRDGFACRYCGATEDQSTLEVDHIVPVSKGGETKMENLQTLCARCNARKSDSLH